MKSKKPIKPMSLEELGDWYEYANNLPADKSVRSFAKSILAEVERLKKRQAIDLEKLRLLGVELEINEAEVERLRTQRDRLLKACNIIHTKFYQWNTPEEFNALYHELTGAIAACEKGES